MTEHHSDNHPLTHHRTAFSDWCGSRLFSLLSLCLVLCATLSACPVFWDDEEGRRIIYTCPESGCVEGDECRTDYDCDLGLYCDEASGLCVRPDTPNGRTECSADEDCGSEDFICDSRATCVPRPEGFCSSAGDCAGDDVCVEETCRDPHEVCQLNEACPATEAGGDPVCVDQRCTLSCEADSDCRDGESCSAAGFCEPSTGECSRSADCGEAEHCVFGRCLTDCSDSPSACGEGSFCADDGFCRPDTRPGCVVNPCSDVTASVCVNGRCRATCDSATTDTCEDIDPSVNYCSPENLCYQSVEDYEAYQAFECASPEDCAQSGASCVDGMCQ